MNIGEFKQWLIDNEVSDESELHIAYQEVEGGLHYTVDSHEVYTVMCGQKTYGFLVGDQQTTVDTVVVA